MDASCGYDHPDNRSEYKDCDRGEEVDISVSADIESPQIGHEHAGVDDGGEGQP